MLANDPHLPYSVPSIWFPVHLQAPGANAAGVSLPGMPAVVLGHNEYIAWGATNVGADVQDIYAEKSHPKDPDLYAVDGKWQRLEVRNEWISIRGGAPRQLTFKLSRHGPIVLKHGDTSYSMRWVAGDPLPWTIPFFAVNAARNWEEFRAAFADYPGPAQNFVYADRAGNIGYQATGKLPIRPRGDGSLPLDGSDSKNDWSGYIPYDALPRVYDPPSGMIATANARIVPDGYPYPVSAKWQSPERTDRIYDLLHSQQKFAAGDFLRMQMDVFSRHHKALAQAFAAALERRRPADTYALRLAAQLRRWDGGITADSSEASLVQFARFQLIKTVLQPRLDGVYLQYTWPMNSLFLEGLVSEKPAAWLPPRVQDFDEMLAGCVDAAVANLREVFHTPDSTRWPWGRLVTMSFQHPLAGQLPAFLRFGLGVPPFRQGGNGFTVKQTASDVGPSMRMVVDFGDLDSTLLTITMGESGLPFDRHFKDQFPAWQQGRGLKFPFSNTAVEHETKELLRLAP